MWYGLSQVRAGPKASRIRWGGERPFDVDPTNPDPALGPTLTRGERLRDRDARTCVRRPDPTQRYTLQPRTRLGLFPAKRPISGPQRKRPQAPRSHQRRKVMRRRMGETRRRPRQSACGDRPCGRAPAWRAPSVGPVRWRPTSATPAAREPASSAAGRPASMSPCRSARRPRRR